MSNVKPNAKLKPKIQIEEFMSSINIPSSQIRVSSSRIHNPDSRCPSPESKPAFSTQGVTLIIEYLIVVPCAHVQAMAHRRKASRAIGLFMRQICFRISWLWNLPTLFRCEHQMCNTFFGQQSSCSQVFDITLACFLKFKQRQPMISKHFRISVG